MLQSLMVRIVFLQVIDREKMHFNSKLRNKNFSDCRSGKGRIGTCGIRKRSVVRFYFLTH